jgi:hypothetical protein
MVALFLSTSLLFAAPAGLQAHRPRSDTRAKAIVNGHPVQPKPSDLRTPDITTRDAADVDRLYRELMELTAPDARRDLDDAAGPQGPEAINVINKIAESGRGRFTRGIDGRRSRAESVGRPPEAPR